jgi:hypothetical protein
MIFTGRDIMATLPVIGPAITVILITVMQTGVTIIMINVLTTGGIIVTINVSITGMTTATINVSITGAKAAITSHQIRIAIAEAMRGADMKSFRKTELRVE